MELVSKLFLEYDLIGLTETHVPHKSFGVPGWRTYAAPRTLRKKEGDKSGGVAVLVRGLLEASVLRELGVADGVPPETVALEFPGWLFNSQRNVVIVLSYATRPGVKNDAYKAKYEAAVLDMLRAFCFKLRERSFEIVLMGDFNAYTRTEIGWNGQCANWTEVGDATFARTSACKQSKVDANGQGLLRLCQEVELRILNGLRTDGRAFDGSITRPSKGKREHRGLQRTGLVYLVGKARAAFHAVARLVGGVGGSEGDQAKAELDGSVIDYVISSEALISCVERLQVMPRVKDVTRLDRYLSDHCPVSIEFYYTRTGADAGVTSSVATQCTAARTSQLMGWRFLGSYSEETCAAILESMKARPDRANFRTELEKHGPTAAYRLIHQWLREEWTAAGVETVLGDGSSSGDRAGQLPTRKVLANSKIPGKLEVTTGSELYTY